MVMDVTLPPADPEPVPAPHPAVATARATVPKRAVIRRADGLAAEFMGWCPPLLVPDRPGFG
ncbi:hypothetical protein GCM10010345_38360 [Streptomyces canarius]|uniref:Uncharacterized protein n=1 Tax=Streptomyces canarius TaxID=285453 RepID=A0ABQ3CPX3_9ACTN|nr:hypothetical protein GCM10010345_38360 [Streptomyces canarius]